MIRGATGITYAKTTTKVIPINIRLSLKVSFIVTCPGPNIRGMGAQAEGVKHAMEESIPISIENIPKFTAPPSSKTTPILKNRTMVTTLETKLVIIKANKARTITITYAGSPANIG